MAEIRRQIMEEMRLPLRWWWLSYPTGVVIVQGGGMVEAAGTAARMGLNPGGTPIGVEMPDEDLPCPEFRECFIPDEEVEYHGLRGERERYP